MNLICASHNDEILNKNLSASDFYKSRSVNELKVMEGYTNVAQAYNIGSEFCNEGLYNIYCHHDVFLPYDFESNLRKSISELNKIDLNWGILGVAGATIENGKRVFYEHLKDRGEERKCKDLPKEVQTLDELLLITRGDFEFDEQFDLHFYGADICLQAIRQGRKNYVISAFVHHNSGIEIGYRSESFKECEKKFRDKWRAFLPVNTCCSLIN